MIFFLNVDNQNQDYKYCIEIMFAQDIVISFVDMWITLWKREGLIEH